MQGKYISFYYTGKYKKRIKGNNDWGLKEDTKSLLEVKCDKTDNHTFFAGLQATQKTYAEDDNIPTHLKTNSVVYTHSRKTFIIPTPIERVKKNLILCRPNSSRKFCLKPPGEARIKPQCQGSNGIYHIQWLT